MQTTRVNGQCFDFVRSVKTQNANGTALAASKDLDCVSEAQRHRLRANSIRRTAKRGGTRDGSVAQLSAGSRPSQVQNKGGIRSVYFRGIQREFMPSPGPVSQGGLWSGRGS